MTLRIVIGLIAALRAVLIYGEAEAAASWEPRLPSVRLPSREAQPVEALAR